jgi:hypothetical protein
MTMRVRLCITQRQLRSLDLLTLLVIMVLVSLLTGCGSAPIHGAGVTRGSPAPAPTTTQAKFNSTVPSGCPSAQPPADAASFKPDVIVSQDAQVAGKAQPIVLAQGQRLEIRLQSMFNWELMMSGASSALAVTGPQGWYDANLNVCVWRFTAVGSGEANLTFDGVIVCPPLKLCPSVEESAAYRVTVR